MTAKQVRQLYNATPFRPFIIHLADGRQIPVKHREFMALSPSGRTMVVYPADDTSDIIDLLPVTDLKVKNGTATKGRHSYPNNCGPSDCCSQQFTIQRGMIK